ncbi:MAG: hypothetical protein ABIN74_00450 [Ferruginibacter sp.]
METTHSKAHLRAVVQQTTNNTTSWIGHFTGESKNRISGQTFTCPDDGDLDCIEIFSSHVTNAGPVDLSIYSFNPETKAWGASLGTSRVEFSSSNTGRWISFPLNGIRLQKGMPYGFRLKSEAGLIGVGEAASSVDQALPTAVGQEWMANSESHPGNFYSYLSLAFKVEMRA